MQVRKN